MHEWAIAHAVLLSMAEAYRAGARRFRVVVGELQNVDLDALRGYIDELVRQEDLDVEVDYVVEEAVLRCNRCGHRFTLAEAGLGEDEREAIHFLPEAVTAYVRCPRCGSRDVAVERGRGVRLVALREAEAAAGGEA